MPEYQMKLNSWQIAIAVVILITIVVVRLVTFSNQQGDTELMEKVKFEIMTDYFPDDVDQLKIAMESGTAEEINQASRSLITSKITIQSLSTSYPLFSFTSNKEVVVKVVFSIDDESGNRDRRTNYYLFKYGGLTDSWRYQHKVTAISYYLNFL